MFQRKAAGARYIFDPEHESYIGIANRDAFEVVVVRGHQVEKVLIAVAVENHVPVARALDDDRLIGSTALRQIVSPVERRAVRGEGAVETAVDKSIVLVNSGMNEDRIARLHARRRYVRMVGLVGSHVVRGE